ncbi:MAG: heparin lyase I family protein [Bauldia sp.]|nr:heparin lyase I family protein [Bauldia sp.]
MTLLDGDDIFVGLQAYSVQNANRAWNLTTPEPGTLRFELRAGDVWTQDASSRERTEIAGDAIYATSKSIGISYDFKIEPGPANTSEWLLIGQLHAADDFSSPIMAIEMVGERLAVRLRYKLPGENYNDGIVYISDQNVTRGQYYHIEIDIKLGLEKNGSLDIHLDGEHIVDYSGYVGYGYGVYWKEGIYRAAAPETIAVDYKGLSVDGEIGSQILGTPGNDRITPQHTVPGQPKLTTEGDLIYGQLGADVIKGGIGPDIIFGGGGKDRLMGNVNDDTLIGGPGRDWLKGGPGKDVFRFEESSGRDVIADYRHGEDLIALDRDYFASQAEVVAAMREKNGKAILKFDGNIIVIKGLDVDEIRHHTDDFLFV